VAFTETLKYYDKSFDKLFDYLSNSGIDIIDADPFDKNFNVSKKFDIVSSMAVLEHYPHSPKLFFHNLLKILNKPGNLYIEVPNIAYYKKRRNFLILGNTPLTNIQDIYNSAVPFTGHHHEYTYKELLFLLNTNNLKPDTINFHTYSDKFDIKYIFTSPVSTICQVAFPSWREVISINSLYQD
jgi:2-polyprenyl-3-methyl-5-hydroxy-6-metoxy-1,4-benzoquinol methylase